MADVLVEWDDKFLIGIPQLDFEHRALIERLNALHDALSEHKNYAKVQECLGSVYARLEAHFALEEWVMKDGDYPAYGEHCEQHALLLNDFADFMHNLEDNPETEYGEVLKHKLEHWLIDHILANDKKMAVLIADKPRKLVN